MWLPMCGNGNVRFVTIAGSDAKGEYLGKGTPIMRKYILVVDDDATLLSLLRMRLKSTGHTVDTAETGWDCLSKLERADYDVVLLDYMMPGITGLTILQHIQARCPSVPVVVMTGETSSEAVAQALAGGARTCLVKPVDPVELEQAMQGWVGTAAREQLCRLHETKLVETRQAADR
jgi:CheY-like chemotaxis protein